MLKDMASKMPLFSPKPPSSIEVEQPSKKDAQTSEKPLKTQ